MAMDDSPVYEAKLKVVVVDRELEALPGGPKLRSLNKVRHFIEACAIQFTFELGDLLLNEATVQHVWGESHQPLLVFIEAPATPYDQVQEEDSVWKTLTVLTRVAAGSRFVRAFVISTRPEFHSQEAQKAWLDYSVVIGYSILGQEGPASSGSPTSHAAGGKSARGLQLEEIRSAIAEMVGTVEANAIRNQSELRSLGSRLRMPLGALKDRNEQTVRAAYQAHRFASFLTGGVGDSLQRLREARQAVEERAPRPTVVRGKLAFRIDDGEPLLHPFMDSDHQRQFEAVVRGLYGGKDTADDTRNPDVTTPAGVLPEAFADLRERFQAPQVPPHILLLGGTGTGKTLLASWLHEARFREVRTPAPAKLARSLFQDLNCGCMSANLIAAELFGARAGAYTDLDYDSPGKIFSACLGTLFLDEIGELPMDTQGVLLKYLDNFRYYPVAAHGDQLFIPTVVIAATNRPLEQLIAEGAFRRDLYERFRFRIRLPSLKERADYLLELVDFVLQNPDINPIQRIEGDGHVVYQVMDIHERALQRLRDYEWPGNFRELEQVLWRAVLMARGEGTTYLMPHHIVFSSGHGF
jgi:hypothetical protein